MDNFQIGIEEEYFVVDRRTAAIKTELPQAFMKAAGKKLGDRLMYELLQSQIEVATLPVDSAQSAREELLRFRNTLAEVGQDHNVGIVAAGTHPLARPEHQRATPKPRYAKVIADLGMVGLGTPMCGLHVHVEVPDPDLRVEMMHRLMPFLPLLLALSTSSPFWAGYDTGLLGYRNAVNDALPRTGFAEMFRSMTEYEGYVDALVEASIVPDATYVWWALRPSLQHPTLELRLTDCCTAVDDAVAIAALYRALVHHIYRDREIRPVYSPVMRALAEENRWRAQRYGTGGTYLDVRTREAKPFSVILDETLDLVSGDFDKFQMEGEAKHLKLIAARGTSAHRQLEFYRSLRESGRSVKVALREVSKYLRKCTEVGELLDVQQTLAPMSRPASAALASKHTRINGVIHTQLADFA
jgi:glutamate---cysteine ligase / carboxylate-amine ligase